MARGGIGEKVVEGARHLHEGVPILARDGTRSHAALLNRIPTRISQNHRDDSPSAAASSANTRAAARR